MPCSWNLLVLCCWRFVQWSLQLMLTSFVFSDKLSTALYIKSVGILYALLPFSFEFWADALEALTQISPEFLCLSFAHSSHCVSCTFLFLHHVDHGIPEYPHLELCTLACIWGPATLRCVHGKWTDGWSHKTLSWSQHQEINSTFPRKQTQKRSQKDISEGDNLRFLT